MVIKEIEASTFDAFCLNSDKAHFMQTSSWARVCKTRNYIPHLLGVYQDDVLVSCALLLEKDVLMYKTFYCPRGPIVDYSNRQLLKETIVALKDYAKTHNGLYLKFDPDLIINKLDESAKPINTNKENLELIDFFKNIGCKHRGFTIKFKDSSNPRFTFRVNVEADEETLLNSFHNTTRKILKRNNPYQLDIYKGDLKDLEQFYQTMKETAKRKKMLLEPIEYFSNFYTLLHEDGLSDIYVVKANIAKLKEVYSQRQIELDKDYEELSKLTDKKQETRRIDLDNIKRKLDKELQEINSIKEDEVILSSIITAKTKDKVWTIHGGNSDKLMFLNGNYELYYHILKDSKAQGYKCVDFFGSEGKVDESSPEYGIYLFKLRFAGDFDEFIGEFDIITKPIAYSIINKVLHIYRRLKIKKAVNK